MKRNTLPKLAAALITGLLMLAPNVEAAGPYPIDPYKATSVCEYNAPSTGLSSSAFSAAVGLIGNPNSGADALGFTVTDVGYYYDAATVTTYWSLRFRAARNYYPYAAYFRCDIVGQQWGAPDSNNDPNHLAYLGLTTFHVWLAPNWLVDTTQPGWQTTYDAFGSWG